MDQQPPRRARGRSRGFHRSSQQTEGTQQPQHSQQMGEPQRPQHLQQMQRSQRPQQPQQMGEPQRPQYPQQMQRPQRPQQPQQMQRPQRPQQPQQMQRLQRPQHPQQMQRPQQPQQMQRPQRPQQSQQMQRPQRPQHPQQMQRLQCPQQMLGQRQMQAPQQVQVQPQGVFVPRPNSEASRPRAPVPGPTQQVEQVTAMMGSMTTTDMIPIGRGAVRGRRTLDTIQYIRAPRPESSKNGKEGTSGQPIQLITNYFPITSYTNWSLYQYKINFSPEEDRVAVKRGLLSNHKKILGPYIFDGESMFSSTKYESDNFELASKRISDDQIVIMSVKFVNTIETNDYANIQVFNLLIRKCLKHLDLKLVGRNYYDAGAKIVIPQHKLELWPGYETTIGMFDNGLLLRAEISTKVMRQETILDFFKECLADRDSRSDYMMKFKAGVIGTVVLTPYNNKTYRIDDVDATSDINSTFEMKDGTVKSYKDYYASRWKCFSLYNDKQPLLVSKKKRSLIYGNDEEELIYLVPEFCNLTGLSDAMRNNFQLMKDVAEYTRVNPKQRIDGYYNFSRRLQSKPECLETFKNWNLTLGNKLINVPARVLPIEDISCNNSKYNGGIIADWTRHLRNLPMYTSVVIKRWIILTPKIQNINAFVSNIQKAGLGMSFSLPQPEIVELENLTARGYVVCLEKVINDRNPPFILCVTTTQRNDVYNIIKRKLCVDRAVPSQVVLIKNVKKNDMSVCTKIAIQINCKLGGAPWLVNIPIKGMMIVGFDVCHDNWNKSLSYGALVASLNDTHTSYFSCVQSHKSGEELSTYFCISIAKALNKYRSKNGELPKSIVIYRDGVGDGQLSYVHSVEIETIKQTFKEFYESDPPFAFIIVKKRISTRFFAAGSQRNQNGIPENPQPGTVIDQVVTDPSMYDFFLVSQNVRRGTVTPTHYNIIQDTLLQWSPDKMQSMTYKLTHMYYNWSGTVRVPAHCQLAHKLAFLTAQSLKTSPNTALDELLYFL